MWREKTLFILYKLFLFMYTDNSFVRFDWAAKYMLRDKADFEVFEGLMTVLIGEPVKIVELLESESNPTRKKGKYNQVDIKAKNNKDEIILVEIQLEPGSEYMQRILFGVSKAITEHIQKGQDYTNVKKVYSINILYYNFCDGEDYLYHGFNQFIGVNKGDTLRMGEKRKKQIKGDVVKNQDVFPEYYILRVSKFDKETAETPLEEWMRYLKEGYIDPKTTAPGLQRAREKLRVLSMTDQERWDYEHFLYEKWCEWSIIDYAETEAWNKAWDKAFAAGEAEGRADGERKGRRDGEEKGRAEGEAIGRAEGEAKGRAEGKNELLLEIVKKMQAEGLDSETIFRFTGYSG